MHEGKGACTGHLRKAVSENPDHRGASIAYDALMVQDHADV
jgi:hypothetical protein